MIVEMQGDLFESGADALVNPINCVGVMGRGLALQFKNLYPQNFAVYATACAKQEIQPGRLLVFQTGLPANPHYIINFPTKRHWRDKSILTDIEAGLNALAQAIPQYGIRSIAIPALGSGLGGLPWNDVKACIYAALTHLEGAQVLVYKPGK